MSTILFSDLTVTPEQTDLAHLLDRASHVTVEQQPDFKNGKPRRLTLLRSIIFAGGHYLDKVASCSCGDLELFRFADEAYTRCAAHGVQDIGRLIREYPRTRKVVKR